MYQCKKTKPTLISRMLLLLSLLIACLMMMGGCDYEKGPGKQFSDVDIDGVDIWLP